MSESFCETEGYKAALREAEEAIAARLAGEPRLPPEQEFHAARMSYLASLPLEERIRRLEASGFMPSSRD